MKKLAMTAGIALAMTLSTAASAHDEQHGYVTNSAGTVWRNSAGECWHDGSWSQDDATVVGCDGYQAAAPAPAPTPAPAPAPAPAMEVAKKFAVFFDFDSAAVGDVSEIAGYIRGLSMLSGVSLVGHADPLGSSAYNMALSQRRANNVAAALANAGVNPSAISVNYMGEAAPVAQCSGTGAALISCLRADRRVDVSISGKK